MGSLLLGHTANILQYLGPRHGLVPDDEVSRLHAHQLQLSVTDFVAEIHDTPPSDLRGPLLRRSEEGGPSKRAGDFTANRMPKFFDYFEKILKGNSKGNGYLLGKRLSYVDLSLFQMIEGLRYAFPRAMKQLEPKYSHTIELRDRVAAQPRLASVS